MRLLSLAFILALASCAQMRDMVAGPGVDDPPAPVPDAPEEIREVVSAPDPEAGARTAEALDTTTDAQKAAASAAPTGGERRLGETVASLGDPTMPGLWIRTPLASEGGSGRIENPANGKSAVVQLIPLEGEATAGSQVSLAALRLLDAPLTDLPTLVVYAN